MAGPEVDGPEGEHLNMDNEGNLDAVCSACNADRPSAGPNAPASITGCSGEASCPDAAERGSPTEACGAPMSKNKQKKLKRQAAFEAKKAAKKAEEKAAKRAHQEKKLSEVQKMIADMSESKRQAWKEQMAQKRQARKQTSQEKRARLQQGQREGQRILIDLDFADKMTHEEIKSLCKQLLYCYSANVRAEKPAQLILTSAEGVIMEQLHKQASGLDNWMVTLHAESYMTTFKDSISDLVYLTADSPNELTELDSSKAYIIGGIVDRNRHKNVCFNKATSQGLSTARLPIDGFLQLNSSFSTVITVNQVFSILVNFLDHKDWRVALNAAIPQRKRMDDDENEVSENGCSAHHGDDQEAECLHKRSRTETSKDTQDLNMKII